MLQHCIMCAHMENILDSFEKLLYIINNRHIVRLYVQNMMVLG